jgi:NADPH:quinone reductase-like Zn-dependent oxidoreductase
VRAVVQTGYGGAESLDLRDVAHPAVGAGQVGVRVHVTGVNDSDWAMLSGKPYFVRAAGKPHDRILGHDVAGEVVEVGPEVTQFRVGDRVFGDLSDEGFGGFAEYVTVAETELTSIPDSVSYVDAAALPHAGNLAMQALVTVAEIQPGQSLLVNGAGGGVGPLIAQLAAHYGVHDTVGVDDATKQTFMREVGFARTLDYRQVDFTRTGEQFDVIVDTRLTRSPFRLPRSLRPGGTYVTVGATTPKLLGLALWARLISRVTGKRIRMLWLKTNESTEAVAALAESGVLKPRIDRVFPLTETGAALARFGAATHRGKIVVSVVEAP